MYMGYEQFFNWFLFPLYDEFIKRRKTRAYLKEYSDNQWKSNQDLQQIQLNKLKLLLKHCQENVPYYQKTWQAIGFQWQDVSCLDDFAKLPVLTKDDIRTNYSQLIADNFSDKILTKATGGSTGQPLKFGFSVESNERRTAVMMRGYSWAGLRPGRSSLHVWGSNIVPVPLINEIKTYLYHAFYNRKILNSFNLRYDNIPGYLKEINRHKPSVVVGYVMPLFLLASYLKNNSLKIWRPDAIITGAEPLMEYQREIIEQAFDCPVFNTYGSREFMLIAAECEKHRGLHINIDHLVVEVCNNGIACAPEESGDMIITDLHNYAMPFIRYSIGDFGVLSAEKLCSCGRGLPLLKSIDGRKLDIIKTPDGRTLPGEFFPHLIKDFSGIIKFQVIQEKLNEVTISLVIDKQFNELESLTGLIQSALGNEVNIQINIVDEIPLTKMGKHRVTISRIAE